MFRGEVDEDLQIIILDHDMKDDLMVLELGELIFFLQSRCSLTAVRAALCHPTQTTC